MHSRLVLFFLSEKYLSEVLISQRLVWVLYHQLLVQKFNDALVLLYDFVNTLSLDMDDLSCLRLTNHRVIGNLWLRVAVV